MKHNSKIITLGAALLLAGAYAQAQTIAAWTFENNAVAINNSPAPSSGAGTASSIGMNIYPTPNAGVTTERCPCRQVFRHRRQRGCRYHSDLAHPCAGRGQRRGQWLVEPGADRDAGSGSSPPAPWGMAPAINVSFDWYATTQGEANLQLQYTTDGATWHNLPDYTRRL